MSRRRLRIAYARIAQETNALSPVLTTLDDFARAQLVSGGALALACGRGGDEAPGFLRAAELSGFVDAARADGAVEAVPLFSAWAVPSGPLSREAFEHLRDRLVEELKDCRRLDGVYLCLHGSMGAVGYDDPDTALILAARSVVGPDVPIAVTLDLHANVTAARAAAADVIVGYRTNPHRDHADTGRRAGEILFRTARRAVRPVTSQRLLPMLLGGGVTLDFLPPMRAIFKRMRAMERHHSVLSVSTFMVHPWLDAPSVGWSTLAITDNDYGLAESLADELAERCWAVRDVAVPSFIPVEQAIAEARRSRVARALGCVVFCDTSDVVTAGAPGDGTGILAALIRDAQDLRAYVPLRDPRAIKVLSGARVGSTLSLDLGGSLDPARNTPVRVDAKLRRFEAHAQYGHRAVVDVGSVSVVITEGPPVTVRPSFFTEVGLDPWRADVVVVKNFFPFRLFFAPVARRTLNVRTRGVTDLDAAFTLPRIQGPVHPREHVADWRAIDQARRGV